MTVLTNSYLFGDISLANKKMTQEGIGVNREGEDKKEEGERRREENRNTRRRKMLHCPPAFWVYSQADIV